jgi:hypothetical protein
VKCAELSFFTGVPPGPFWGPLRLCVLWLSGSFFSGVKRPANEAGHSYPARVEIKNKPTWSCISTPFASVA